MERIVSVADRLEIREAGAGDRSRYMSLLLLGDESERMIARCLGQSTLYVGFLSGEAVAVCCTVGLDDGVVEVKNLAVAPGFGRRGIGRMMLAHAERYSRGHRVILGTGETPSTLRFYRSCGYVYSHRIPDFFTANYDNPIVEEGVTLRDMIYLKKEIPAGSSAL